MLWFIIIVILLLGGGGTRYAHTAWGPEAGGGIGIGTLLVCVLVFLMLRGRI